MARKIKELLNEKSFWRGLLYLFAFIFQIMLIPVALVSLSSELNTFQLIALIFIGFCNCFVFIKMLQVIEDKHAETETQAQSKIGSFNMGDKVSATPTPKSPSATSHHPNIKLNLPSFIVGVEKQDV